MKIKTIRIKNFKNIEDMTIKCSGGINAFIGKNGSGKSAVFEAVNFVLGLYNVYQDKSEKIISYLDKRELYELSKSLDGDPRKWVPITHRYNPPTYLGQGNLNQIIKKEFFHDPRKRMEISVELSHRVNMRCRYVKECENFFNKPFEGVFVLNVSISNGQVKIEEHRAYRSASIDVDNSDLCIPKNSEVIEITDKIRQLFSIYIITPEIPNLDFINQEKMILKSGGRGSFLNQLNRMGFEKNIIPENVRGEDGYIDRDKTPDCIKIEVGDMLIPLNQESDGNKKILHMANIISNREASGLFHDKPLFIDEPDLLLHPRAKRKVYDVLKELSESMQVFYTTHDADFLSYEGYHDNGKENSVYKFCTDEAGRSVCLKGSKCTSDLAKKKESHFDTMNATINFNRAFFADFVFLVEGYSDVRFLRCVLENGLKLIMEEKHPKEVEKRQAAKFELEYKRIVTHEDPEEIEHKKWEEINKRSKKIKSEGLEVGVADINPEWDIGNTSIILCHGYDNLKDIYTLYDFGNKEKRDDLHIGCFVLCDGDGKKRDKEEKLKEYVGECYYVFDRNLDDFLNEKSDEKIKESQISEKEKSEMWEKILQHLLDNASSDKKESMEKEFKGFIKEYNDSQKNNVKKAILKDWLMKPINEKKDQIKEIFNAILRRMPQYEKYLKKINGIPQEISLSDPESKDGGGDPVPNGDGSSEAVE